MTIEPKLMDADRLAHLEHEESLMRVSMSPQSVLTVAQLIRELRGHAKHWEAAADEADKRTVAHFEECVRLRTVIEERERERLEVMRGAHDREDLERRELAMILGLEPRGETVMGLLIHVRVQLGAARLQIKKFRDRCPVEASDVKEAGVSWAQCYAVFMREIPDHRAFLAGLLGVMCTASEAMTMDFEPPEDPHEPIAGCVSYIEMFTDRDRWNILAEMAAMDPS